MSLAERLHMSLSRLLSEMDSQEIALWRARDAQAAKKARGEALMQGALAALPRRSTIER